MSIYSQDSAVLRAIIELAEAIFKESSPAMDEFSDWVRQKGGLPPPKTHV